MGMDTATATVKGGLFPENGVSSVSGYGPKRFRIAQYLGVKGKRKLRELMLTLNGAAPGSAALATQTRIEANEELSGKRVVETETLVNRNTTADDVTEINDTVLAFNSKRHDPTPVPNLDGNPLGTR